MKRTKTPRKKFSKKHPVPPRVLQTVENIAYKIAWSFNQTTRVQIEELISEARLEALEGVLAYDNLKKSHISTYVYVRVTNRLIAFVNKEKRHLTPDPEMYDFKNIHTSPIPFFEIKDLMTEDCKFVAQLAWDNRDALCGLLPKAARGHVVDLLRQQGWSWPRIWRNIKKMKQTLNEIPENCITY